MEKKENQIVKEKISFLNITLNPLKTEVTTLGVTLTIYNTKKLGIPS